jgi:predicted Zn-dependent protease
MNKVFLQFSVLVIIFLAVFFGLCRVDFMKHFHLAGVSDKLEHKIGGLILKEIKMKHTEIEDDSVTHVLNEIKNRLCTANSINPDDITLHLMQSDEVNAFAIPGHDIIVYTGLIKHCDSVSELCGVLGHEMGHIELGHVMKRMGNELGVGVLSSIAGGGNSQVIAQIVKMLSSTAFERKQESEADAISVTYLQHAHINPYGFVNIMDKLADMHSGIPKEMEWISSHPDSRKRAITISSLIDASEHDYTPAISDEEWTLLKNTAREEE